MGIKLRRIWRAVCAAFWTAWKEVPPKKHGALEMHLSCDTSQVEESLDRVLHKLERIALLQSKTTGPGYIDTTDFTRGEGA